MSITYLPLHFSVDCGSKIEPTGEPALIENRRDRHFTDQITDGAVGVLNGLA